MQQLFFPMTMIPRQPDNSEPSQRLKLPKTRRLRSSLDFKRIYELKQRRGDATLLVFAARNEIGTTRIGLSISKKNGNSVVRHRIRRLIREAYRLEQCTMPEGLDLILIPRPGSNATLSDYRNSLPSLAKQLDRKIPR